MSEGLRGLAGEGSGWQACSQLVACKQEPGPLLWTNPTAPGGILGRWAQSSCLAGRHRAAGNPIAAAVSAASAPLHLPSKSGLLQQGAAQPGGQACRAAAAARRAQQAAPAVPGAGGRAGAEGCIQHATGEPRHKALRECVCREAEVQASGA